jgi:hypothetical protein
VNPDVRGAVRLVHFFGHRVGTASKQLNAKCPHQLFLSLITLQPRQPTTVMRSAKTGFVPGRYSANGFNARPEQWACVDVGLEPERRHCAKCIRGLDHVMAAMSLGKDHQN